MNKQQISGLINYPVKLEAALKMAFAKLDTEKKGYVSYDVIKSFLIKQNKEFGLPEREGTQEEKDAGRKLADPEGTGKVTCENFIKFMKVGIQQAKASGYI